MGQSSRAVKHKKAGKNRDWSSNQESTPISDDLSAIQKVFVMAKPPANIRVTPIGSTVKLFDGKYVIEGVVECHFGAHHVIVDGQGFNHIAMLNDVVARDARFFGATFSTVGTSSSKRDAGYRPENYGGHLVQYSEA